MNIDSAFYHNRLAVSKAQKVQPNQHTKQHTEIHWDGQLKKKTSPFPEGAKSAQLTFEWFSGKKVSAYYSEYFSFVDEMKGVSSEKKEALKNLIQESIMRDPEYFASGTSHDKKSMYHVQTKEKLYLLAEYVVPEQYKNEMKQAANDYTDARLQEIIDFRKKLEAYTYNKYKGMSGYQGEFAARSKQTLDQIENGEHRIQKEQRQFKALFSAVGTNPEHFQKQYQEALEGYKENQRETYGVHLDEGRVNRNIELLRKDWNEFVSSFSELKNFAVSTEEQPLINKTV